MKIIIIITIIIIIIIKACTAQREGDDLEEGVTLLEECKGQEIIVFSFH